MIFTVCTATFNRAHTLHRVFDSLVSQTERDFEWLVIDDGSTDGTADMIGKWASQAPFAIRYQFQENQGKHVAINLGTQLARGRLFLIADSDDAFLPDALENFLEAWNSIPKNERCSFTGVTGLCVSDEGQVIGDSFPTDVFDTTSPEVFYRHGVRGEKWGFHRTDVLRQFPFPVISGLGFFSEGIVWHAIGRKFRTRFINKPVRIYKQDAGDQLTTRSAAQRSQDYIFYVTMLEQDQDYLFVAPWQFYKTAIQGVRFSLHHSVSVLRLFSRFSKFTMQMLWCLAILPGILLYLRDLVAAALHLSHSNKINDDG